MTQMVYDSELCDNDFIREALDQTGHNRQSENIALDNHPFAPFSGFTQGTPVFTHYTSPRRKYGPMTWQ